MMVHYVASCNNTTNIGNPTWKNYDTYVKYLFSRQIPEVASGRLVLPDHFGNRQLVIKLKMVNSARNYVFTLNNYTPEEKDAIATLVETDETVLYVLFGHEFGDSGTPHLQGLICFSKRKTIAQVKALGGFERAHLEVMRATFQKASDYCKKQGDWLEFGEPPAVTQGKRSDLDDVIDWVKSFIAEHARAPCEFEIAQNYPKQLCRYKNLPHVARLMAFSVPPDFQPGEPREWQSELESELSEPSVDDRKIIFYVDPVGNSGKTWFSRYFLAKHQMLTQILGTGSYNDLSYMIDETRSVFFFNVPRGGMEFLPYRLLESLKDRMVQSNKYESRLKLLRIIPHVVVFANEKPDMTKLSQDRYCIRELSQPNPDPYGIAANQN